MEYDDLGQPIKDAIEELKGYVDIQITYNKLVFTRKTGELSSYILLLVLLLATGGLILLFLSFAFAGWFGDITKLGIGAGYLVVAGFYVLLAAFIYIFRKKFIFNPTRKIFGNIFFGEDNTSNEKFNFSFDSDESYEKNIKAVHEELLKRQEDLNQKIKVVGDSLTFTNISHQIIDKAYQSFVTTTNMAKFAFNVINRIRKLSGHKKRKIAKKENKKLEKDIKD